MTREISKGRRSQAIPRELEKDFQVDVIEWFESTGWLVSHAIDSRKQVRLPGGGYKLVGDVQAKGYPDLTLIKSDVFWIELKREGEHPDLDQIKYLEALPPHKAFLAYPDDRPTIWQMAITGEHPENGQACWACERRLRYLQ